MQQIPSACKSRIVVLEQHLANQIAAGEVIERPNSVVKEILENSLDAGATKLNIVIEQGGIDLIRVRDNGCGIYKEDLTLALQCHATSKIRSIDDLYSISSLGFRGEALASISSVARVTLASRLATENVAWQISVAGDDYKNHYESDCYENDNRNNNEEEKFKNLVPLSHPIGTTIEVRDLFFNVPARRKFLRTPATEFSHILEVVRRLVLSRFDVALYLQHNEKSIFSFDIVQNQQDAEQRLAMICGEDFVKQAIAIFGETVDLKVKGWIALPTFTRNQPDLQYFYVNGRIVRDKTLAHAVRYAYQDLLPTATQRYPAVVLYLDIDPSLVDVNVHPTKSEVRFREGKMVHDFIAKVIKKALGKDQIFTTDFRANVGGSAGISASGDINSDVMSENLMQQQMLQPQMSLPWELEDTSEAVSASIRSDVNYNHLAVAESELVQDNQGDYIFPIISEAISETSEASETILKKFDVPVQQRQPLRSQPADYLGHALVQLRNTYILAENEHGLVIVDIHAAHERITYEKLKAAFWQHAATKQTLLQPITLVVSAKEAEYVEMYSEVFDQLGLEVVRNGPTTVMVRCLPVLLKDADIEKLVRDVLADLIVEGMSFHLEKNINKVLATMACYSSVRAGRSLSVMEMNSLLRQIEQTENSSQCSHGRPTWIKITLVELQKMFQRM